MLLGAVAVAMALSSRLGSALLATYCTHCSVLFCIGGWLGAGARWSQLILRLQFGTMHPCVPVVCL